MGPRRVFCFCCGRVLGVWVYGQWYPLPHFCNPKKSA